MQGAVSGTGGTSVQEQSKVSALVERVFEWRDSGERRNREQTNRICW